MSKQSKGYYFQVLPKGKFKKESFIEEKLNGLNGDPAEIAKEALAACESGGVVYAAHFNNSIAKLYIFTASGTKKEKILEMTGEYLNNTVLTPETDLAFETDVKEELINQSDSYSKLIFRDFVVNKGDYKIQYSVAGMLLGFAIGVLLWGIIMDNISMGIALGVSFGVCYGLVFAKHIKVEKTDEAKTGIEESKAEEQNDDEKKTRLILVRTSQIKRDACHESGTFHEKVHSGMHRHLRQLEPDGSAVLTTMSGSQLLLDAGFFKNVRVLGKTIPCIAPGGAELIRHVIGEAD